MFDSKIDKNAGDFLKLVTNFNSLQADVSEDIQAMLLNSLSHRYDQFKKTLRYGRDTLSLSEITGAVRSKKRNMIENGKDSRYSRERKIVC